MSEIFPKIVIIALEVVVVDIAALIIIIVVVAFFVVALIVVVVVINIAPHPYIIINDILYIEYWTSFWSLHGSRSSRANHHRL